MRTIGFVILVSSVALFVFATEECRDRNPRHDHQTRDATAKTIAVKTGEGAEHVSY
jgi:hypothetical protein